MIKKYRKKPVVVEAVQWLGNNFSELIEFIGGKEERDKIDIHSHGLYIKTLEGNMKVNDKDFVIKGVKGEFYPCKPDIFYETYEEI